MRTPIDPRLAARRRSIAEDGARHRLRWMLWLGLVLAVGGLAVWASQSTLLDVDFVRVHGVERSGAEAVLDSEGIIPGTPIVAALWRAPGAEDAIEADPWVRDASVSIVLPDAIELEVVEYEPAAWIAAASGWLQVAADGVIVAAAPVPGDGHPLVEIPGIVGSPGGVLTDQGVRGALEFFAVLDSATAPGTVIAMEGDGLWAHVRGRAAKLGRPEQMAAKAAAFQALLGQDLPEGMAINLVAPMRPALFYPDATFVEE